jgi:hypothetical protein
MAFKVKMLTKPLLLTQCTLDYLGADCSVCRLSVHESLFDLRSICFIKLHNINMYTDNFCHKSGYIPV